VDKEEFTSNSSTYKFQKDPDVEARKVKRAMEASKASLMKTQGTPEVSSMESKDTSKGSSMESHSSSEIPTMKSSCSSEVSLEKTHCSSEVSIMNSSCSSEVSLEKTHCSNEVSIMNSSCDSEVSLVKTQGDQMVSLSKNEEIESMESSSQDNDIFGSMNSIPMFLRSSGQVESSATEMSPRTISLSTSFTSLLMATISSSSPMTNTSIDTSLTSMSPIDNLMFEEKQQNTTGLPSFTNFLRRTDSNENNTGGAGKGKGSREPTPVVDTEGIDVEAPLITQGLSPNTPIVTID
jgi:hypothetical protein